MHGFDMNSRKVLLVQSLPRCIVSAAFVYNGVISTALQTLYTCAKSDCRTHWQEHRNTAGK